MRRKSIYKRLEVDKVSGVNLICFLGKSFIVIRKSSWTWIFEIT